MLTKLERPVLILNKNWTVIGTSPLYKTMNLLLSKNKDGSYKAHVIDEDFVPHTWEEWGKVSPDCEENRISTINTNYKIPEVIRLNKYDKMPRELVIFSRHNIFRRDENRCQYCGKRPGSEELTIDHVIPKCQGGKTTWENCVLACTGCNSIKGGKAPHEVRNHKFPHGMTLIKKPVRPKVYDFKLPIIYKSWAAFLSERYWNVELENDNK
jgi:5-methylcytosine-specific restriction endonuclease McrA